MFTYHYCMSRQDGFNGTIVYSDGIAKLPNEIKTMDDYRELKKIIEPEYFASSTITSLTLLCKD